VIRDHKQREHEKQMEVLRDAQSITDTMLRKRREADENRSVITASSMYANNARYVDINSGFDPRIRLGGGMHPLNPDECDVYTSLVDAAENSVITASMNHHITEGGEICGFRFTCSGSDVASVFPVSRKMFFRTSMVECRGSRRGGGGKNLLSSDSSSSSSSSSTDDSEGGSVDGSSDAQAAALAGSVVSTADSRAMHGAAATALAGSVVSTADSRAMHGAAATALAGSVVSTADSRAMHGAAAAAGSVVSTAASMAMHGAARAMHGAAAAASAGSVVSTAASRAKHRHRERAAADLEEFVSTYNASVRGNDDGDGAHGGGGGVGPGYRRGTTTIGLATAAMLTGARGGTRIPAHVRSRHRGGRGSEVRALRFFLIDFNFNFCYVHGVLDQGRPLGSGTYGPLTRHALGH
jgi:hypothetical protein